MFVICLVCLFVFNATFNSISVISLRSVLLVEETGGAGEKPPIFRKSQCKNQWRGKFGNNDSEIWSLNFEVWSPKSEVWRYLSLSVLSPLMLWVRISIRARRTTLCDKVCQWLATGRWFSPSPPVSFTNKTEHHDITEILLLPYDHSHDAPYLTM
jgi:hypothetical protein